MNLTAAQALQFASQFSSASKFLQEAGSGYEVRSNICELAIRVALLKAQVLARHERATPLFGESRQTAFASA